MRLLKGLLGKPKAKQPIDPAQAAQFDQEWAAALKRFGRVAGFESFAFDLKHPQTMQPLQPHEGLGGTFEDWKQITAPWDRQRLLMDLILSSTKGAMKPWQVANVLVALRLPQNALQLLKQSDPPPQEDTEAYSGYCESYARALQYLQQPHEALPWIEKSLSVTQNHLLRQRHADILYLTGECEPALKLYTELIEGLELSAAPHDAAIPVLFASLFAFDTGRIPSPVLAVDVGEKLTDAQQSATFWQLGEAEFYDSAFFRMHHGYVLAKQGEPLRCLAKLVALVQEMPWLREANLNLEIFFRHLDPSGTNLMPEFQRELRKRISEHGWTTDGMAEIGINLSFPINTNAHDTQ